jgi:Flp pilus assembly protein TadG
MLERFKRRALEETGVAVVLVAIMMIVFLGMAAMAIDIGSFYGAQKHAQSAADSAALAAAQDIAAGTTGTTLTTDVNTLVARNDPGATATITTPYNGNAGQVKVSISSTSPTFFGKFLGVSSANIGASAAAGAGTSGGAAAVFAKSTTCGSMGVTINGSSINIPSGVHSNGVLWINGSSLTVGGATYGGPNNCNDTNNGSGNTLNPAPARDPNDEPWPYDYSGMSFPSAPSCTFSGASFTWSGSNVGTIPTGTYCATSQDINLQGTSINATGSNFVATSGKVDLSGNNITESGNLFANGQNGVVNINGTSITLNGVIEATGQNGQVDINGSNISGNVTIIATALQLNGSSIKLAPYPGYNNLLAYQTGCQALTINGSGYLTGGTVFAPNADITLNGSSNSTANGFVEGQTVTINGAKITIIGTGPSSGGSGNPGLIQ